MRKIKRVPIILQMEAVECGAACLSMVLAYYGRFIPLDQMRKDCCVSKDGCSVSNLVRAGRLHGLTTTPVKMSSARIRVRRDYPIMIHWKFHHFVVLCGFSGKNALINDPAQGRILVPAEEFDRSYTGIAVTFHPSEEFARTKRLKNGFLSELLQSTAFSTMLMVSILALIYTVLQITQPLFYQQFTDEILLNSNKTGLIPLLITMAVVSVMLFVARLLQEYCFTRLSARSQTKKSHAYVRHLLRLPEEFFFQRFTGSLVARLSGIEFCSVFTYSVFLPTCIELAMCTIYIVIMAIYQLPLALLGIGMCAIQLVLIFVSNRKHIEISNKMLRDNSKLDGYAMSAIDMMETIKSCGAERGTFQKISGAQAAYSASRMVWKMKTEQIQILLLVCSGITDGIILFAGIFCIFSGYCTIGMLMAFQGFLTGLLTPLTRLANTAQGLQNTQSDRVRTADVMRYPVKPCYTAVPTAPVAPVKGSLELKSITFGYHRLEDPIIRDFSLSVPAGKMVVLTGTSGCGKSTLLQLVAGQYQPFSGELLLDGLPLADYPREQICKSLSMVSQSICLFSGTIRENLSLWDRTVSDEEMIRACKDAEIFDMFAVKRSGLDTLLSENGRNISGGQRQQLEIARALVRNPSVLLMDEATSALDPITEKKVMDNIRRRGITLLVVAHRLSAIRDADEIIVMERGRILERGTHARLAAQNGVYAQYLGGRNVPC